MTIHQRLGRKIAVALGALSMLVVGSVLPTVTPASADHGIGFSHWSNHEWLSLHAPNSVNGRGFFILDRTGNSTMSTAIQDVIRDWKFDLDARGWRSSIVPNVEYIAEPQYAGACGHYPEFGGYHFVTVCQQPGPGAVTYSAGLHNGDSSHPYILIGNQWGTYTAAYNLFFHELFHAAGIGFGPCTTNSSGQTIQANPGDHSCDPANLLYTHVPVNVIKRPTGHDWDALHAGYVNHPMFS